MIKIFTGDNRVKASQEIKKLLGENYEVIDCTNLTKRDLPQIFKSSTLFDAHRRILMRDFTANSDICPELINYLNTPHDVILLETKLDKRTAAYKEIKNKLESMKDDEEMKYDNMPEGLQESERGDQMQEAIDALDNAVTSLDEAIDSLNEI